VAEVIWQTSVDVQTAVFTVSTANQGLAGAPMFLCSLLLAIITLLISPVAASAEMWPSRPVKILVPYAAGGNSDGMAG
jgi:hypothetical protein